MIAMLRFKASSLIRFLILGSVFLFSPLHAQDLQQWKPNVGDQFECQVSDYSSCGDFMCSGLDTILFVIVDTSFNADDQHPNSVLAATSAIGLHLTYYQWGFGWDSSEVAHDYFDTTLLASTSQEVISTTFDAYNVVHSSWTQIPLVQDTPVIFQGVSYPAFSATSTAAVFLPTLGWFLSLFGYESAGPCVANCIEETWTMTLIAASTTHSSVQSESNSNSFLLSNGSILQLVNVEADKITLMDLVGRAVNVWQFPASGLRDITLNVADVPSGVYFLRISVPGVKEMRKVVIVH
jgi:hypothetical protein